METPVAPEQSLPPYFGIQPDAALADLGHPVGTGGFAALAQACAKGRADLVGRGLDDNGARQLRLFSTWEITRYLIPVAPGISAGC
jgi:chromosome partitioning protein